MSKRYYVTIYLNNNKKIKLCLDSKYAPVTVENFIKLVKSNYYNGTIFHRIIADFMIQTGGYYLENNTLNELRQTPSIIGEFKSNGFNNELMHKLGVISMARKIDKNSATSQFFICVNDCPWLDGEYAAFGRVIDEESLNVILEISKCKTGSVGNVFNDFPYEIIFIEKIDIIKEED